MSVPLLAGSALVNSVSTLEFFELSKDFLLSVAKVDVISKFFGGKIS